MDYQIIPKTFLSIIGVAILLLWGISCQPSTSGVVEEDVGCGPFPDKFKVKDFSVSIKKVTGYGGPINAIRLAEIENGSVQFDELAIDMRPDQEFFFSRQPQQSNSYFVRSVHACSPTRPVSDDTILDIQINSDKDFNSEFAAGDNLVELFDVYARYERGGIVQLDLPTFIDSQPNAPDHLVFLLKSEPGEATEFQFTIQYFQEGEALSYFEATTDPVTILP
jgi:hypothetical protein